MSKLLADLLELDEHSLKSSLGRLELASGQPGVDLKIMAEIKANLRRATGSLGMDPSDTTGKELYHGLIARVTKDNERLAHRLAGIAGQPAEHWSLGVPGFFLGLSVPTSCWVLKRSSAKELLHKLPPKALMKKLGYRSIDSMLKNENVGELFIGLRLTQPSPWMSKLYSQFEKLNPGDFENRVLELVSLSAKRWLSTISSGQPLQSRMIVCAPEVGALALPPFKDWPKQSCLRFILLILGCMDNLRAQGCFIKLQQVEAGFGKKVAKAFKEGSDFSLEIAGQNISWAVIRRHYSKKAPADYPAVFDPHVQPEDLSGDNPLDVLAGIDEHFGWWHRLESCALSEQDGPVSLNIFDMAVNYATATPYEKRCRHYFQQALYQEILLGYLTQPFLNQQLTSRLDNSLLAPETVEYKVVHPNN